MKIEIGGVKIEKNGITIELTAEEAQEIRAKLNSTYGLKLEWPKGTASSLGGTDKNMSGYFTYEELLK
jgi:hypothetical protein